MPFLKAVDIKLQSLCSFASYENLNLSSAKLIKISDAEDIRCRTMPTQDVFYKRYNSHYESRSCFADFTANNYAKW